MASMPARLLPAFCLFWCSACLDGMQPELLALPDDVQALVQRSAKSSIDAEAASDEQPVLSVPVCTAKDLADYEAEVQRVQKAQARELERVKREAAAKQATQQAPVNRLWQAIQEAVMMQARRTVSEAAMEFLPTILRTKNRTAELPKFHKQKLERKVKKIWETPTHWATAVKASVEKLDAELEQRVDKNWSHLVTKVPGLKTSAPKDSSADQVWAYFLKKVLPVTILEGNPELEQDVVLIASQLPQNVSHYERFIQAEVTPLLMKKKLTKLQPDHSSVQTFTMPLRRCRTCGEQYGNMTWGTSGSEDQACSNLCSLVLFSCTAGFTNHCLAKLSTCLECHTSSLMQLDACNGANQSSVTIARFNRTVSLIKKAGVLNASKWEWVREPIADRILSSLLF